MDQSAIHYSAGGVVYRSNGQSVDICLIKDMYGHWTLPKGHMEPNETLEETARREINEETGIDPATLRLRRELGEINYHFTSDFKRDTGRADGTKVNIHKYVTFFLYEVPYDTELTAQQGEVEEIAWLPLADFEKYNEYEHSLTIIKAARQFLGTK